MSVPLLDQWICNIKLHPICKEYIIYHLLFFRVASNTIKTTEHLGTHLDAPQHFNEFSWTMDQIPIDHLVGPGVIVDVKEKVASNSDYQVTKADLEAWEDKYGKIPDGAIVLMNSGWHDKYPNKELVFGSNTLNDRTSYHFPGWHIDAVEWLVGHRSIHVLGSDTPSFDYARTKRFPVHVLVSKENICGLENVAYLDKIPASGTIISAAAMKIVDGSGSPTRVFALVPQRNTVGRNQAATMLILFISVLSILFIT